MTANDYLARFTQLLGECVITKGKMTVPWNEGFGEICDLFVRNKEASKQLFFIGNGGSAGIAEHFLADFLKNGGMRTVSLLSSPLVTCISNDYGYEEVYARPLSLLGRGGDILVAVSSSGNSPNIVKAVDVAKEKKMYVLTLTGFEADNKIRGRGDYNIYVPIAHYGLVESIHSLLLQQIVDMITDNLPH